jgi:hypothetical protein
MPGIEFAALTHWSQRAIRAISTRSNQTLGRVPEERYT